MRGETVGLKFSIRKEHRIKGIDVIIQDALTEIYRNGTSSPLSSSLPSSPSLSLPIVESKETPSSHDPRVVIMARN